MTLGAWLTGNPRSRLCRVRETIEMPMGSSKRHAPAPALSGQETTPEPFAARGVDCRGGITASEWERQRFTKKCIRFLCLFAFFVANPCG
uniref:Uncharacterized protein n=1 Tax=Candidatus Kentrum sp. SD TaxID=2126332 RepID=A0A450Z1E5_9GAMM|nr:MAG: hypothetical protein BECKSD772F_GA0070984_10953 [Candidatus Kentron sp. SD]VFK47626.1 MAG: hypothetical protein BECKSD772E_GA0070983_11003 [Candidatus Kentron sp. SD]